LFSGIKNLKHKTLLIVIYNSGLRISEAINLMVSDVDFENKIILEYFSNAFLEHFHFVRKKFSQND